MRCRIRFLVLFMITVAVGAILFAMSLRHGIDVKIRLTPKVYSLGEPVELTIDVHNRFPVRLISGSWIEGSEYACEQMTWAPGIVFSLHSVDRGALSYKPRWPNEGYVRLWIEPGERAQARCDMIQVFNLSRPGSYKATAEISGNAFMFDDSSWRQLYLYHRSVTAALAGLSESVVTEFEVRRLSETELVEVRDRARTGDIAAIRIIRGHEDTGGVEALDQVWTLPNSEIHREAAQALAEIPGRGATDALGHGMVLESDPDLKEKMAWLIILRRQDSEVEPWMRKMTQDTLVFHEIEHDGKKYRFYRLREFAREYFEKMGTPIDVDVMEQQ